MLKADELQTFQKTVVVGVASDPEPGDRIALEQSDGTVRDGDAHGVHRLPFVDLLELEAGVLRVLAKEGVGFSSGVPNIGGQLTVRRPEARRRERCHSFSGSSGVVRPAARSARASAASLLKIFCDAANWRAQWSSSRSSSSSQRPTRSCSSGGSVASLAMAASSVRVIGKSIADNDEAAQQRMQPTRAGR